MRLATKDSGKTFSLTISAAELTTLTNALYYAQTNDRIVNEPRVADAVIRLRAEFTGEAVSTLFADDAD